MKKVFTSLLSMTLAVAGYCQSPLILTQSNYPYAPDSTRQAELMGISTPPASGANKTWDYSTATLSGPYAYGYPVITNDPLFVTAKYEGTIYFKNLTPSLGYNYNQYFDHTTTYAGAVGISTDVQRYGIGQLTTNNADSLIVLASKNYYPTTPRKVMVFPGTYQSSFKTVCRNVVDMQLTVTMAGLNKAPLTHVFYTYRSDTIIGWGNLTLPTLNGGKTAAIPMLQERIIQYNIDSFYLNGVPASAQILSAFGIKQNDTLGQIYIRDNFYRANAWIPALIVNYSDPSYSTVTSAFADRTIPTSTGIIDLVEEGKTMAYPNPVTGSEFMITIAKDTKVSSVNILDMTGREVAAVATENKDGIITVSMTRSLSRGLYLYQIRGADNKIIASGKIISSN